MLEIVDINRDLAGQGPASGGRPAAGPTSRPEPDDAGARLVAAERTIARLTEQASLDELTGALRRGAGWDGLVREISRVRRSVEPRLVVAFVDVDHLKRVNDSQGHAAGDRLIRGVAEALRARFRSYDLVIRWGGDEFVCVLPDADLETAERSLGNLREQLMRTVGETFTCGLASLEPRDSAESLLLRADENLYAHRATSRSDSRD